MRAYAGRARLLAPTPVEEVVHDEGELFATGRWAQDIEEEVEWEVEHFECDETFHYDHLLDIFNILKMKRRFFSFYWFLC